MTKVVQQYAALTYEAFALSIQLSPLKWEEIADKLFFDERYMSDNACQVHDIAYEVGLDNQSTQNIRMLRRWFEHRVRRFLKEIKSHHHYLCSDCMAVLRAITSITQMVSEMRPVSDHRPSFYEHEVLEEKDYFVVHALPPYIRRKN